MLLIPAIDLKDGRCVRLKQGKLDEETIFSEDPAEVARRWRDEGAERIHLVDLNGAFAGKPQNASVVRAIIDAVGAEVPVQLGGGIRSLDTIERYLEIISRQPQAANRRWQLTANLTAGQDSNVNAGSTRSRWVVDDGQVLTPLVDSGDGAASLLFRFFFLLTKEKNPTDVCPLTGSFFSVAPAVVPSGTAPCRRARGCAASETAARCWKSRAVYTWVVPMLGSSRM